MQRKLERGPRDAEERLEVGGGHARGVSQGQAASARRGRSPPALTAARPEQIRPFAARRLRANYASNRQRRWAAFQVARPA